MLINLLHSCFTDCAGAMTLAYEKPEADIMTRPPRDINNDHLVDGQLILHAYGFIGILECGCSMAMSFWHMQRRGIPFGALWLKYGNVNSALYPPEHLQQVVNEASSIYFVNLVIMYIVPARDDTHGKGRADLSVQGKSSTFLRSEHVV